MQIAFQFKGSDDAYNCTITQQGIDDAPDLALLYPTTDALFQDLKNNFDQVVFTEDGVIIFELALHILGKTSKKQIRFYAKKKDADPRVDELRRSIEQMAVTHMQQMEALRAQHSMEIGQLRREMEEIKQRLLAFESQKGGQGQGFSQGSYGANFTTLNIYDENNGNKKYFSVVRSESSIKIIKVVDSVQRNFALNLPIPKGSKNTLFITQVKTKSCSIKYGIITKALISQSNTYINKDSIALYAYNGHFATAAKESWDGKPVKDGSVVALTIDTFDWRLSWDVTAKKAGDTFHSETYIPEHMRAADLYVCIAIEDENDTVEITLVPPQLW